MLSKKFETKFSIEIEFVSDNKYKVKILDYSGKLIFQGADIFGLTEDLSNIKSKISAIRDNTLFSQIVTDKVVADIKEWALEEKLIKAK